MAVWLRTFGYPVDVRVQDAVDTLNRGNAWYPAIESTGEIRDGAWVAAWSTCPHGLPGPG
jgi:hypothetical protein